eukprot:TRINITY_DN4000_c0_g1_i11.p2 TRINITY_DN4000_c0_g1~~TRINITY_DN4000_c0_g1_i11.p2  ORF type:complete len:143 (+),score=29.05 TRINITY_DN4000_c0_g1_i11:212-640(+)
MFRSCAALLAHPGVEEDPIVAKMVNVSTLSLTSVGTRQFADHDLTHTHTHTLSLSLFPQRIKGRIHALSYVMVEYDVPEAILDQACKLTPGIEAPTVASLHTKGWFSVKSMIKRNDMHEIMDQLWELGCKGIVVTQLESARV